MGVFEEHLMGLPWAAALTIVCSRGWEVMEERALSGVTKDYLEISSTMTRLMDLNQAPNDTRDIETLRIQWAMFENLLLNRVWICDRATANLTSIHEAYTLGAPLLTYKYTKVGGAIV